MQDLEKSGVLEHSNILIDIKEEDEPFKINNKLMKLQKWIFISLVITFNVLLSLLAVVYYPNFSLWILVILLPKIKDIFLILLNIFYSNTLYSINIGLLIIITLIILFYTNLLFLYDQIDILIFLCISIFIILSLLTQQKKQKNINHPPRTILVHIFVYCERISFILRTIEDIHKNIELSGDKCLIKLVMDGQVIGKHNNDTVFNSLTNHKDIINVNKNYPQFNHKSWKLEQVLVNIATCKYKNIPIILIEKVKNQGKKDSIYLAHIFSEILQNQNHSYRYLYDYLKKNNIQKIDYIFKTDADSHFEEDCIKQLKHTLEVEPKTQAVCGIIKVSYKDSRKKIYQIWNIFQDFQYYFSQIVRRNSEGTWGKVVCIPGPVGLYRNNKLYKKVNMDYAQLPNKNNLIQYVNRFVGTDRRYTSLFMLNDINVKVKINLKAISYTYPPQTLKTLVSQRVRWGTNNITNNLIILTSKMFPLQTRITSFVDLYRLLFIFFRIVLSIYYIIALFKDRINYRTTYINRENYDLGLIRFVLIYTIPIIYFMPFCIKEKKFIYLMVGFILNKIFFTFILTYIVLKILLNFGNISWGNTQKIKKDSS